MKDLGGPGRVAVGLTGPIAAGKSLALRAFARAGACAVSADAVAAELLTRPACYNKILRQFDPEKILTNGALDKRKLAAYVFSSRARRKRLEALLHPLILREIRLLIEKSKKPFAVVEVPLLFEAGLQDAFALTVCLAAPAAALERRALSRGWTRAEYRARAAAQWPAERKYAAADLVLDNSGSPRRLEAQIKFICRFLKETAQGKKR